MNNKKKSEIDPKQLVVQNLLMRTHRNRLWISIGLLTTFILLSIGIILAVSSGTELDGSWKEILMLMLGAFIGWAGKVIDFWFNSRDLDREMIIRADEEADFIYQLHNDNNNDDDDLDVGETSDPQLLNG